MSVFHRLRCWRIAKRFPGYRPQPVTTGTVMRWLAPHNRRERKALLQFLESVHYITEEETQEAMVTLNTALLQRLTDCGIGSKQVIYVQVHDAGSSSPVMLNLLRDGAHLDRLGCHFVDSRDGAKLASLFAEIEEGALVYVDDFAGTGNQLCGVLDMLAGFVPTTFAEFAVMPAICEEAYGRLSARGVEPYVRLLHGRTSRPLDPTSTLLESATRDLLRSMCARVFPPDGLGYERLASHVVLYRNAPNTIPAILRGSKDQRPYPGLFPRTNDFPPVQLRPPSPGKPRMMERLFRLKRDVGKANANATAGTRGALAAPSADATPERL